MVNVKVLFVIIYLCIFIILESTTKGIPFTNNSNNENLSWTFLKYVFKDTPKARKLDILPNITSQNQNIKTTKPNIRKFETSDIVKAYVDAGYIMQKNERIPSNIFKNIEYNNSYSDLKTNYSLMAYGKKVRKQAIHHLDMPMTSFHNHPYIFLKQKGANLTNFEKCINRSAKGIIPLNRKKRYDTLYYRYHSPRIKMQRFANISNYNSYRQVINQINSKKCTDIPLKSYYYNSKNVTIKGRTRTRRTTQIPTTKIFFCPSTFVPITKKKIKNLQSKIKCGNIFDVVQCHPDQGRPKKPIILPEPNTETNYRNALTGNLAEEIIDKIYKKAIDDPKIIAEIGICQHDLNELQELLRKIPQQINDCCVSIHDELKCFLSWILYQDPSRKKRASSTQYFDFTEQFLFGLQDKENPLKRVRHAELNLPTYFYGFSHLPIDDMREINRDFAPIYDQHGFNHWLFNNN